MNFERGLVRLFAVFSVFLVLAILGTLMSGENPVAEEPIRRAAGVLFSTPFVLLIFGAALFWAFSGFRTR